MATAKNQNGNGANLGFEEKLWAAADKLRGRRGGPGLAEHSYPLAAAANGQQVEPPWTQRATSDLTD